MGLGGDEDQACVKLIEQLSRPGIISHKADLHRSPSMTNNKQERQRKDGKVWKEEVERKEKRGRREKREKGGEKRMRTGNKQGPS